MGISEETYRQQFQAKKEPGTFSPRRLGWLLLNEAIKRLHPMEKLSEAIQGQTVLAQFMRDLASEVRLGEVLSSPAP